MRELKVAALVVALAGGGAAVADEAKATVEVDFTERRGEIRPGLHSAAWRVPLTYGKETDFQMMRDLHLHAWRTHDAPADEESQRVVDTHFIFPLMHLDPKDPKNYFFKTTDNALRQVREDEGREIFYRLGTTIEHTLDRNAVNTIPPEDPERYAEVLAGIVRHYNRGWANGYKWNIRYWELFNEPDVHDCWRGTQEQFIRLFITCLKRLKAEFGDTIKVGGPAFAWLDRNYTVALFGACKKAGVRPDFYSWHHYGTDPDALLAQPAEAKKLLEECGFPGIELVINEWHYLRNGDWSAFESRDPKVIAECNHGPSGQSNIDSAAYTLSVETGLQDTCLDQSIFYGFGWKWQGWGCWDPYARKLNKVYYAMKIMGEIVRDGKWKVPCTSSTKGVRPFAALSADGREALVVVADYKSGVSEIVVEPEGLEDFRLDSARVLDFTNDLKPVPATQLAGGRVALKKSDKGSACVLLRFVRK